MDPDRYCQDRVLAADGRFYLSVLFAPSALRRDLIALEALCIEIGEVPGRCSEPLVAERKLAWWAGEIEEIFAGAPQHPVSRALRRVVAERGLAKEGFLELVRGAAMQISPARSSDWAELRSFLRATSTARSRLAAEICAPGTRASVAFAERLGVGLGLARILRHAREDFRRGRVYFPVEDLQAHGLSAEDLLRGRGGTSLREPTRVQMERARSELGEALSALPDEQRPAQLPGITQAEHALLFLRSLEKADFAILDARLGPTRPAELWCAWRTARRERARVLPRERGQATR